MVAKLSVPEAELIVKPPRLNVLFHWIKDPCYFQYFMSLTTCCNSMQIIIGST